MMPEARLQQTGRVDNASRVEVLGGWQKTGVEEKLGGDMYWQFGYSGYGYGRNHDDGFTIFLEDKEAQTLVYQHAKEVSMEGRSEAFSPYGMSFINRFPLRARCSQY